MEWKTLISHLYLGGGAGVMFPITYFFRRLIIKKLQENATMSEKTKQIAQGRSISPIIFTICFIPFALMSLDIYRHPIMENVVFGFCGLIPAADSFVNLFFINSYKQAVLSHFRKLLQLCNVKQKRTTAVSSVANTQL